MKAVANLNKYASEFFGTLGLVFFGTMAIVVSENQGGLDNTGIGIVFGLIVMAMIYSFGQISGAHINPAVTLAFWLGKEFPTKQVIPYITAQLLGGICASLLVRLIFPQDQFLGSTMPKIEITGTFIVEVILSMFLMIVIFHVSKGTKEVGTIAGIAIGATVAIEAIVCGPLTGASMNPARSIGPALISGNLSHLWLYIVAPILGMLISIPIWKITKMKK